MLGAKHRYWGTFAIWIWAIALVAQRAEAQDSTYFKLYKDCLIISPYVALSGIIATIHPRIDNRTNLDFNTTYTSNNFYHFGVALAYNDLSVASGFSLPITHYPATTFGTSKYSDYSISLTSGKWLHRAAYANYHGFGEQSLPNRLPNFDLGNPIPFRQDLAIRQLIVGTTYIVRHKKLDLNTIVNGAGHHYKSAGSFTLGTHLHYIGLNADSSMIDPFDRPAFASGANDIRRIQSLGLNVVPGFAGIWAGKHFFFSGMGGVGIRFSQNVSYTTLQATTQYEMNPVAKMRLIFGYNRPKWYFLIDTEVQSVGIENAYMNLSVGHSQLYYTVGYRWDNKPIGYFLRKIPLLNKFI